MEPVVACVDAKLAIGQCRLRVAWNLWSKQLLAPPVEDVITRLEFPVDLLCDPSWVSRMKQKKVTAKFGTNKIG